MVPKRILSALLASVGAGVVPRTGAAYLAIGRQEEMRALVTDLSAVADGGACMRLIVGQYGSGKRFLLQLLRGYALENGFLCADADLSPERRFCGSAGAGTATYRELMKNLSSKTSAEGGALPGILSKWLSTLQSEAAAAGDCPGTETFTAEVSRRIFEVLRDLEAQIGGFDLGTVLSAYYRADCTGDDALRSAALRWLRGEFRTRTEARAALGVNAVIDDENWYDYLKLLAVFFRRIGYRGFVVLIDECVNLYKIPNRVSREKNYEKILSMFNDTLQGKAQGLYLLLGGTPQFLEDERRGLFSYEALKSRLCDSRFLTGHYKNLIGPVIRLCRLSDSEMLALVQRMARLHGEFYGWQVRLEDQDMEDFVRRCTARAGADSLITPREILRDFCAVLNILYQNEDTNYAQIVDQTVTLQHENPAAEEETASLSDGGSEAVHAAASATTLTLSDLDF